MKSASALAIGVALMLGAAASAPALAQNKKQAAAPAQPAQWAPKMSPEEVAALQGVEKAINAKDWAAASTALAAAQPLATSADARYFVGQYQYTIGQGTNNEQLQSQGIETIVASGGGDATKLAPVYRIQGQLAVRAKNYAKAEAAYTRLAQLAPNDPDVPLRMAEVKYQLKKPREAYSLIQRVIAAQEAAGQAVPEAQYLFALQSAVDAQMWPEALTLSKDVVSRSPNPKNWRNALLIFRQSGTVDATQQLDTLRLMRATKSLDNSNEYMVLASQLARGRFYAEAKNVLEEGFASGKLSRTNADATTIMNEVNPRIASDRAALPGLEARARAAANGELATSLANGYFGHGDYAKAADFYRLALEKGAVDANLTNSRMGIALALAGQRAPAEAALKAVTGPRTALSSYWLLWLAKRG